MRSSNRFALGFALFALLAGSAWSSAAVSRFATGNGGQQSAIPLGERVLNISFGTLGAWDKNLDLERASTVSGVGEWVDVDKGRRLDFNFALAYGVTDFLDVSFMLPYYTDEDDRGKSFSGVGDLRMALKLNYPTYRHNPIFELSLLGALDFPTGDDGRDGGFARDAWVTGRKYEVSRDIYTQSGDWTPYGGDGVTAIGMLLTTLNLRSNPIMMPMLFHWNVGVAMSGSENTNALLLGAGAEVWFCDYVGFLWSMDGQMDFGSYSKYLDVASIPYQNKIGFEFAVPQAGLAIDVGLVAGNNGNQDADNEWNECAEASNAGKCKGATGDVIDSGDEDYVHVRGDNVYKQARYPSMGFYAGISYNIDFKKLGGVD